MDHEFRQLPVKLSQAEVLTKGRLAAKTELALGKLEDEKAESARKFSDDIKRKRKELDVLASEVDTGTEIRPVRCELVPRWSEYMVDVVRADTSEIVESRPMTHAERQMELGIDRGRRKSEPKQDGAH